MKKGLSKFISTMLAACLMTTGVFTAQFAAPTTVMAASGITVSESKGWLENCYIEWTGGDSSYTGYNAYVKKSSDSNWTQLDNPLIRKYSDCWRADAVGLSAGTYDMKVVPVSGGSEVTADAITATNLTVQAYDRAGAAFSPKSTYKGAGAYNTDGTLKSGAKVIYITPDTAKTVKATIGGVEYTGFQNIVYGLQKGAETAPIDIRIVGMIMEDDMDSFGSSSEGLQIKGKSNYSNLNLTIEGIGEDAGIHGFGMLIRNAGNVELRNFAVMACMDDAISLDTANCNVWVHNMDYFYGKTGGDTDQAKGDGTVDMKGKSTYITVSYNHFFDNGKSSLCGMKSEVTSSLITYHHNWFDHSDSRHPRIRTMSVHVYNNYFDGNAKYGVGVTMGSSAFVENNYFRNVKNPMMSSGQGTDALGDGTFSGEEGGVIKAYNNTIIGAGSYFTQNNPTTTGYDAYEVTSRSEQLPSSVTAVSGGTSYNNFDTDDSNFGINVTPADIDDPADVPAKVTTYAGRVNGGDFKWTFDNATEDTNYNVITDLKSAVVGYTSPVVSIGGNSDGSVVTTTETTTKNQEGSTETTTANQEGSTETTTVAPVEPVEGAQVHNFTLNGKDSSFYTITGNLTSSYGTVSYNGLTLTQALKMESSTNISFDPGVAGTLTLVTNPQYTGTIELNGDAVTIGSDGVATVELDGSQSYDITKGSGSNYLFYMSFVPTGTVDPTPTVVKGDADDNGKVEVADVTMIMNFAVGKISAVTNADNADVTADKTVDVDDAYKISQFLNGIINTL